MVVARSGELSLRLLYVAISKKKVYSVSSSSSSISGSKTGHLQYLNSKPAL